jgi:hypothetical protein
MKAPKNELVSKLRDVVSPAAREQAPLSAILVKHNTVSTAPQGGRAMKTPSPDSQKMLDTLKIAVNKALEKKKRLGQYAVIWADDKPVVINKPLSQTSDSKPQNQD